MAAALEVSIGLPGEDDKRLRWIGSQATEYDAKSAE